MRSLDDHINLFDPLLDTVAALVVVLDPDGMIIRFNKACQELTGYTESEALGQNVFDLLFAPDELSDVRPVFDDLKGDQFENSHANAWLTKTGDKRLIQWSNSINKSNDGKADFVLATGIDITDKQYALSQLKDTQDKYARAVTAGRIAIWELDIASGVRRRYGRIWDDEEEDLQRENLFEETLKYVHLDDRAGLQRQLDAVKDGKTDRYDAEFRVNRPGKSERWVQFLADTVRDEQGTAIKLFGIVQDVTQAKSRERQLDELQHELQQVTRLSAMGEIAAAIAHELNQPLTAANSFTEAAKLTLESGKESASSRAIELLDKSTKEILRSGQIIKRIRQFVSSDDGNRINADINGVVREAGELGLVGSASAAIAVTVQLDDCNPAASIDSVQIHQVLINLMRNAIDAMTGEDDKQLVISTSMDNSETIRVSVADSGPGIDDSIVDRLFEPFVTTKRDGMGIGLSVCKTIVESHGGKLWAEPNSPRGTVFAFTLPVIGGG